jgi:tryptophan synthase beta chain
MSIYSIQSGGYYGTKQEFGGQYIPEILFPAINQLEQAFARYRNDSDFLQELNYYRTNWIGRPSPLILADNLSKKLGGATIYLKNEGNNLTGSHKINHCLYQILLAKRMGKTRIICETGAGQHGLATATVCAKFGLECVVYMGQKDIDKQYPNVFWMEQLGAKVVAVTKGNMKLTDAVDEAMADWIANPESYYLLGSAVGPHPYPEIMREAQRIIGQEIMEGLNKTFVDIPNPVILNSFQNPELTTLAGQEKVNYSTQKPILPDYVMACIGGGSNAIGAFDTFLEFPEVKLIGVEQGGSDDQEGNHSTRIANHQAKMGILEGFKSKFLLKNGGQVMAAGGVSAGLGYVGIGPFHAYLHSIGRIVINSVTDQEVIAAFKLITRTEGLLVALESCHAVAEAIKIAPTLSKDRIVVINLSGRADNYIFNIAAALNDKKFEEFRKG